MNKTESPEQEKNSLPAGLPHVAYVLLWFPLFTQPFIFREVDCLRKVLPLAIYTLYGKNLRHCSEEMRDFSGPVHRFGLKSIFAVCGRALMLFFSKPRLCWQLFRSSCWQRWGSLEILGENLWGFFVGLSLGKIFQEEAIDLVYAPWPRGAATAARVGATLAGIPFALAARGDNLDPADPDLGVKFAEALFVRANNAADQKRIQNFAAEVAKDKTELIYNSLTLPQKKPEKESIEKNGDTLRLLAVGRFDVTKGFDDLLQACAILRDRGVDFHLTLAGGGGKLMGLGNLEESLRKLRKDLGLEAHVSMPGLLSHDELPALLGASDIFVAPCVVHKSGRRDGIPNTIIEAMAYGLPIISTNINALPEVIRNKETGLAVNPGQPQELAEAIIQLAANPKAAQGYAQAARELAASLFNCTKNAEKMTKLFQSRYRAWQSAQG